MYHLVNVIKLIQIVKSKITLLYPIYVARSFVDCRHLVNVIRLTISKSDHIKHEHCILYIYSRPVSDHIKQQTDIYSRPVFDKSFFKRNLFFGGKPIF